MRYHSKLANVAAVAILTLACDTSQPQPKAEWPRVERPPIVQRSPIKGADPDQPGFHAFAQWDCSPGDSTDALTVYVAVDTVFTTFPPEVTHFRIQIFDAATRELPGMSGRDGHAPYLRPRTELAHRTFHWPADEGFGKLLSCHYTDCKRLDEGRVTFGDVRPNHFVEGTIDVGTTGNISVRRHFKANWGPRTNGCG